MAVQNRKLHSPEQHQEKIRRRLIELRSRFSQSEIARRTGQPVTNVHRFLREGKIPAEFCASLVESFEVNPAWLLAGQGGALLTDLEPQTAKMGGEMLAMVEAMNAVSRVRLGALAGKQQEQSLRELSDSIGAYDRLRERMNSTTRPILQELLQRYRNLTVHMELERAQGMRRACQQIAKFCDDDELLWQLDEQQAAHEHLMGRVDEALRYHLKLFAKKMLQGGITSSDAASQAGSFVLALRDSGRFAEARRICKAAIALTPEEGREWFTFLELRVIDGSFDVELGELHRGLAEIQQVFGRLAGRERSFSAIMLARAELLAGIATIADVRNRGDASRGRSRLLLRHASAQEDASELKATLETCVGTGETQVMPEEYDARRASLLYAALSGKTWLEAPASSKPRSGKADYLAQFEKLVSESPPPVNSPHLKAVIIATHRAQFARVCGKSSAGEAALSAQKAFDAVPKDRTVTIDLRAQHARNVLSLPDTTDTREHKSAALRFLNEHESRGYILMREFKPRVK